MGDCIHFPHIALYIYSKRHVTLHLPTQCARTFLIVQTSAAVMPATILVYCVSQTMAGGEERQPTET